MKLLCRLWFRVPPAGRRALARTWLDHLRPGAAAHGLRDEQPDERDLPDDIVAYTYPVETIARLARLRAALEADPAWQSALANPDANGAPLSWGLELYTAPVTPSPPVIVSGGTRTGLWLNLDTHDGLPSVLISDIADDPAGNLYLATYEGICHFDGARATMTPLPGNDSGRWAQGMVRDEARNCFWLHLTSGELWCYDGEQFAQYSVADGLPDGPIAAVCLADDGDLWAASVQAGCSVLRGDRFVPVELGLPPDLEIGALRAHRRGLLVGSSAGLYLYADGSSAMVGVSNQRINAIGIDGTGQAWTGGPDGIWAGPLGALAHRPPFDDLGIVSRLAFDREGGLWLATGDCGLGYWDGTTLSTYATGSGLSSNHVRAVFQDRRGHVWAGVWGSGLSRFDGHCMEALSTETGGVSGRFETMCEATDGTVWIGAWGSGVLCSAGDDLRVPPEAEPLGEHLWSSLRDDRGRLWFGTLDRGAWCWDGYHMTALRQADGLGCDSVWGIHQDRDGRMWFATQGGGLTCLDGDSVVTYTTADGLGSDQVWAVAEDADGAIWASTLDTGVCRLDGDRFTRYTVEDGLAHNQVWSMLLDRDGYLWFGTWGGGVSRFDGREFTNYTTRDGLVHNSVRALCQSDDGHLWFGTFGGGVSHFDGHTFQTFSSRDGLAHDAVQHILQTADGRMWIATENGITRYLPPAEPPAARLTGVVADQRYDPADLVTVSTAQRLVTFEFDGASFSTPRERLAYTWRLRGHDDTWHNTRRRRAEIRDLGPGRYTFEVRVVDRDLNYSVPAAVDIAVEADPGHDRLEALQAELSLVPRSLTSGDDQFIGQSAALSTVLDQIDTIADSDLTVLITGETGTGKGLAARALHALSSRRDGPLLQVNCGAIPEGLVESELFGHEKGAFTGAVARKIGRFELAEGGTLFLDEIGDLPLASQRVLLHVLQEGVYQRVGGTASLRARVRVVAATNRDLRDGTRRGAFREDLYYRLSPFVLELPPLRQRREDIPLLFGHFIERFSRHLSRPVPHLSAEVVSHLQQYRWPGNVRELEHLANRAVLVCRDGAIHLDDLALPETLQDRVDPSSLDDLDLEVSELERSFLLRALEAANWVIYGDRGAARRLGVHPEKLRRRMRRLGLKRPRTPA